MELHQLRYFVAVAERLHFTRAAQDLAVAQPSISRQISRLEAELGSRLFHRDARGVVLTQAGEALLPWARRVLEDVAGARAQVGRIADRTGGRLAVGATPSLSTALLPTVLARFHREHPGIALTVREAGSRDLLGLLARGDVELALVILPVQEDEFSARALFDEDLVLAVPPGHPLAGRRTVAVRDLRDVPLVMFREGYDLRATTVGACQAEGFEPTLAVEGAEMDGALRMVAAGLGVAVVPASVIGADGSLAAVRIAAPRLRRQIGLASRRGWVLSPAAERFAQLLDQDRTPAARAARARE